MDDPLKDSLDDYIEKFKHPFWSMTLNEAFESHLALESEIKDRQEAEQVALSALAKADDALAAMVMAIQTHRDNVWGSGEVKHDEDVALYDALAVKEG